MTAEEAETIINETLDSALAQFAEKRGSRTEMSQDAAFEVNAALRDHLSSSLLEALSEAFEEDY